MIAEGGHLGEVGDTEDLVIFRQTEELLANPLRGSSSNTTVNLVEDEGPRGLLLGEQFQGQHDSRQLPSRGDFGERTGGFAGVGGEEELGLLGPGG